MKVRILTGLTLMIALAFAGQQAPALVLAQGGGDVVWSPPLMLSNPDFDAWPPSIVADMAGNVHIMWSETVSNPPPLGEGDTIYYKRWNAQTKEWSETVDVLVSPRGASAAPELAVTSDGMLHAVWQNGGDSPQVLYARAPACCADNPWSWSEPKKLGGPVLATIAFASDRQGRLHVVYADEQKKNIVYRRSDDGGDTWPVWKEIPGGVQLEDEYTVYPRMAVDERGRVHVVWTVLPWPGRRIMYARSDDGGDTWNKPRAIDASTRADYYQGDEQSYGPMYVDIEAQGEDTLHLIWDGAPTVERNYAWSSDGGKSWSRPVIIFPQVSQVGRSGWNDMAIDSLGRLHAVSLQANDPPLHSMWNGSSWSTPDQLPTSDIVELLRITVSGGNILHVVWVVKTGRPFTVWYMQGKTSSPAIPPQPLPTPDLTARAAASVSTELQSDLVASDTTTGSVAVGGIPREYQPVERINPGNLVLMGAVPVLMVLGLIFAIRIGQIRWPKE